MKPLTKTLYLGGIIWFVPFFTSFFVWDVQANAPSISPEWFTTLMFITLAIGLSIAIYHRFKEHVNEWRVAITWYVELAILDLLVLVLALKLSLADYVQILVAYLIVPLLTVIIGKIKKID